MANIQESSDFNNTVRISARRFEESPYIECYGDAEIVRGVYAGRYFAISTGEDPVDTYWTLRTKALLFDVPEKPIEISGVDAVSFLETVLARRISTLKQGRGRYAIACTPKGGVFMDGVVFNLDGNRYWYVQADGDFETWLMAHSGGFDVTIFDPRSRVIQIQGPASFDIMSAASGGAINEEMKYFHAGFFDLGGQQLYVSRTGFTGELGFEIYGQGAETDHPALWRHLMAAGAPHGMAFSSTGCMTIRRVEAGIMGNLSDMNPSMTPFAAGLGPFIDMDVDFIGRAALEDADRRSRFFGLICHAATPSRDCIVLDGDEQVGWLTTGLRSPTLECGVGYVRFAEPGDWIGRELKLRLPDGAEHPCGIVSLPFVDPGKRIVRGLDRALPQAPDRVP